MYSSHESVYSTDPGQWNQHQVICKQKSWYNDHREINSLLHGMKNYPQARENVPLLNPFSELQRDRESGSWLNSQTKLQLSYSTGSSWSTEMYALAMSQNPSDSDWFLTSAFLTAARMIKTQSAVECPALKLYLVGP